MDESKITDGGYSISLGGEMSHITNDVATKDYVDGKFSKLYSTLEDIRDKVFEIKNPTQFIFINKGLNMNPGKVAAQIAHAEEEFFSYMLNHATESQVKNYSNMIKKNPRTTVVLEVKDTDELYKINAYLESCDIITSIYVDESGDEYMLEPTVMLTDYVDKEDPRTKLIFENFSLYKEPTLSEDDVKKIEDFHRLKLNLELIKMWCKEASFGGIPWSRKEAIKETLDIIKKLENDCWFGKETALQGVMRELSEDE